MSSIFLITAGFYELPSEGTRINMVKSGIRTCIWFDLLSLGGSYKDGKKKMLKFS
jgi:hypothetical protein